MSPSAESFATRATFGFLAACVSSVFFYGALRVVQSHLFAEPNPATVLWSAHAGYYWRCWTVGYAGLMVGFLGFGASRDHATKVAQFLVHGLSLATAMIIFQGLFVP